MVGTRAALAAVVVVAAGLAALSGGSEANPRTPAGLPGMAAPFLGTAVVGSGGLAAAIDAYGDVVDIRAPGPAGAALIDNPADRQATGSVSPRTGIVPLVRIGEGAATPMWRADSVAQRYLPGTNVVRTVAAFALGPGLATQSDRVVRVEITDAARGEGLARLVRVEGPAGMRLAPVLSIDLAADVSIECEKERRGQELALICPSRHRHPREGAPSAEGDTFAEAKGVIAGATRDDRRWLSRARPLGPGAPVWAWRMYWRSLLVLRALIDRGSGAVAAGIRDGWSYVWPRDAATAALALAASGYRAEARRVARFLTGLDLNAAARFDGDGAPVSGRAAQGDAAGWVAIAARATSDGGHQWRDRSDYQEGAPGDYLANAIAARDPDILRSFENPRGLVRRAGAPGSGLDSAAAWAVRPFAEPVLFPAARKTLLRLADQAGRFGITPGEAWPHADPWTAPTAWSAWSLAALGERRRSLHLLTALRRAATPAGTLPERLDVRTGIPRSTTPLAWSHTFAILALRTF